MSLPSMPSEDTSRASLAARPSRGGWLRALVLVGLAAGLLSALQTAPAAGEPDPNARPPLQGSALTVQLDALTPADASSLDWRDPDDDGNTPSVALTRAEERALLEEARACDARLRETRAAERARNAPVLEALEATQTSLNFVAVPLAQVIAFLQDTTELNYVIAPSARTLIADESVEVTLELEEISLINALTLILASHEDLTFRVREGVVLIQNGQEPPRLELAAFAVEDIVSGRLQGQGGASISSAVLVNLVEDSLGFLGSVEYASGPNTSGAGSLVVRAPPPDLAKIRALLRQLRVLEREPAPEPQWIAHYRAALTSRRVTLDFLDTPLSEVLSFLEDQTGLRLTTAPGVDTDLPVELRLREVLLKDALRLILEQVDLLQSFAGETLVIHERGDERYVAYEIEVLDVRDILSWLTPTSLDWVIQEGLEGDLSCDWDPRESLEIHRGQLILRQTRARNLEFRQVLAKLRASHAQSVSAARVK